MIDTRALDQALRYAVETGAVPGVVATVTSAEGPAYEGAAGVRAAGGTAPMTADTVFWIASMTKAITSAGALLLVEDGVLALDAPLGPLLPALAAPRVLEGFDADGAPRLRPARGAVTLRHLLTHTSGFSYDFANADLARFMEQRGIPPVGSGRLAALDLPLLFDPGERWEYGISTDWAGRAIEAASGQRLDAFLRDRVLGPLGMDDTVFAPRPDQRDRLAALHRPGANGGHEPIPPTRAPEAAPEFLSGGGGLHSTARDYAAFLRAILRDGAGVLRPESVAELRRNQVGDLRAGRIPAANPAMMTEADFYPGQEARWSLAFLLNPERGPLGRSPGCLAWAGLANTYYWVDPSRGLAVVVMMQVLPSGDPGAIRALAAFEGALYGVR